MLDIDGFIDHCRAARADTEPRRALKEVLDRACSEPSAMATAFQPNEGGIDLLYLDADLTVIHVVWPPRMAIFPHDHRMWAAVGIYAGAEDNTFYRRSGRGHRGLTESGGRRLDAGDVLILGTDTIHGVSNPKSVPTAAIHVYGGDFLSTARSQWGPGPREERPYDPDDVQRAFDDANRAWREC